jgi:hypothetical protein
MGVLHRNCIRQWKKGPRGKYQAPEELVADVRDLYLGFLQNPAGGRLRTADAEKPWLPLCMTLTKTAHRQLWATEPETVSHVGKNAVADLTVRMRTLLAVRAQIKARGTGPGWLRDVFGDRYSAKDILHVLDALLEPGVSGQPLSLDPWLDELARGLIRLSPRVVGDGRDAEDWELEEDDGDDSEK